MHGSWDNFYTYMRTGRCAADKGASDRNPTVMSPMNYHYTNFEIKVFLLVCVVTPTGKTGL